MLNPVSNAIREIQTTIPSQILTEVFGRESYQNWRRAAPVSIDEMIKSKVIRPRVLKDCNLIGGRQAVIPLDGLVGYGQDQDNDYATVFNVPMTRTGNREIMSVLSVGYLSASYAGSSLSNAFGATNLNSISDTQISGQRVLDSVGSTPHVSSASVELIGYNTVIIRDSGRSSQAYELRCMLANDENLSNLSPRSYRAFAKACILAVKSYIFNDLDLRLDQGRLEQGQELGRFREIVDRYQDAEEQYQEYQKLTLAKVFFMNDMVSMERFIRSQINPSI